MAHDGVADLGERPATQSLLREILRMDQALLRREAGWAQVREAMQAAGLKFKEGWRKKEDSLEIQRAALQTVEARLRRKGAEHEAAFLAEWRDALSEMDRMRREIREKQPLLSHLTPEDLPAPSSAPKFLALGRLRFALGGSEVMIAPRLTSFPPESALWLEQEGSEGQDDVRRLILRLLTATTPQGLRLAICDPSGRGEAVAPFLPLFQAPRPFVDRRVLTRAEEIERALGREAALLEEARRSASAETGLREDPPFTLIVVFDYPTGLSEAAQRSLAELIRHGPAFGTTPLLIGRKAALEAGAAGELLRGFARPLRSLSRAAPESAELRRLTCVEEEEPWPEAAVFSGLLLRLAERFWRVGRPDLKLEKILPPQDFWSEDAKQGFSALLGRDGQGGGIRIDLGACGHLLATGAAAEDRGGATALLIRSFLHRHSPKALRLALLDFSAESRPPVWMDPPPPHADLLMRGIGPEQGLESLRGLLALLRRRADLLPGGAAPEARLLAVLRESPALFIGDPLHDAEAERLLLALTSEGAACGIHVLLTTARGEEAFPASLRRQEGLLRLRSAKAADEDGSFGQASPERFRAVLESASGAILFEGPRLEPQDLQAGAEAFRAESKRQGGSRAPRLFIGGRPPPAPALHDLRARIGFPQIGGPADPPRLWLGEGFPFHQEDVLLDLEFRAGSNLLVVGDEKKTRARLLQAMLWSLACCDSLEDLAYLGPSGGLAAQLAAHAPRPLPFRELRPIPGEASIAPPTGGRCKILLLDASHAGGASSAPPPWEALEAILGRRPQEASAMGILTIAFIGAADLPQVQKLAEACVLRIGFGLNREQTANLCGASAARTLSEGEALFGDLRGGRRIPLRPFRSLLDAPDSQAF